MEREYYEDVNRLEDIWDLLSLNLTKTKLYKHRFSSTKINDIRFCFHQSKELFDSALKLSYSTFPLQQYYSFNILTKILILVKNKNKKIDSLQHAHGLSAINVNFKTNRDINGLKNISVKINKKGTFSELLNIYKADHEINILNQENIYFEDILYRIIDIYGFCETNKVIPIHDFNEKLINADTLETKIYFLTKDRKPFDLEKIKEMYPDFKYFHNENFKPNSRSIQNGIFVTARNKDSKPEIYAEFTPYGNIFLCSFYKSIGNQNVYFNQIEIIFIFTYFCSSLVRYYPDLWEKILLNDDKYWILKKALKTIFISFPNHILSEILEKKVIFWPSSDLISTPFRDE